jgi:hypothetical protein
MRSHTKHKTNCMKKVFWIFSICALSLSTAFGQDDNYYSGNDGQNVPPANYNTGNNYDNNQAAYAYDNGNYNTRYAGDDDDYASYDNFYYQLSPYGNWVNYPGYGNVWVPNLVAGDFSPYATAGHWIYTDYGWSWVSDYSWGAIPFHYGRWFRDDAYGWMWVPGYQWAAAWVTWGSYDNYYCWAPLAPYVSFSAYYRPDPFCWNFVDREHFCDIHLGLYHGFYGRGDFRGVAAHINVINESRSYANHTYCAGPRVNEVERSVGHPITTAVASQANLGIAVHNNNAQLHQQGNANQYRGQGFANNNNQQVNHFNTMHNNQFANNNMQNQVRTQQFNGGNNNMIRNNSVQQYQRPNMGMQQMPAPQQNQVRPQQFNGGNYNMAHNNYGGQYQRPDMGVQQRPVQTQNQFSNQNHLAQSYRGPQQNFQHSQPVQRPAERNFASAPRPSSFSNVSRPSGGGNFHGGRR